MGNVPVFAVCSLLLGIAINNPFSPSITFDIVNDEFIINCNRYDGLHLSLPLVILRTRTSVIFI